MWIVLDGGRERRGQGEGAVIPKTWQFVGGWVGRGKGRARTLDSMRDGLDPSLTLGAGH